MAVGVGGLVVVVGGVVAGLVVVGLPLWCVELSVVEFA